MTRPTMHAFQRAREISSERPPEALVSFQAYRDWHLRGALGAEPTISPRQQALVATAFTLTAAIGYGAIRGRLWWLRRRLDAALLSAWREECRRWWTERPRLTAVRAAVAERAAVDLAWAEVERERRLAALHVRLLEHALPNWEHPA